MIDRLLVLWLLILGCALPVVADPDPVSAGQTITLLRHAEKQTAVPDPGLTTAGLARAKFIAAWLGDTENRVEAIWSSDYRRTRDTAQPIADRLDLAVRLYDPGELAVLAERLRAEGVNAVVIGHSNTTPELAALLCECAVAPMPETNYETGYQLIRTDTGFSLQAVDFLRTWTERPMPAD
ncbi:MAG: histidine phosphatase family protein [Xanthomonadales bacterium]|nr:histidine phosphatase family protein [Xanthomonadales bacterium]